MIKGGLLKDDTTWDKVTDLKNVLSLGFCICLTRKDVLFTQGYTFMLMGTADALPQAPVQKTVFVEDMTEQEQNVAVRFVPFFLRGGEWVFKICSRTTQQQVPAGLVNLGNTCYMNATLQTLRGVPELSDALAKYSGVSDPNDRANSMTVALRDVFSLLKSSGESVSPFFFVGVCLLLFFFFFFLNKTAGA